MLPVQDPISVTFLPFVRPTFNNKVLSKHNINTVGLLPKKISSFLQLVKDNLAIKTPGAYSIPCICGMSQPYVPLQPRPRNTISISGFINQKNLLWQNNA
jgi:hypothetical protein